MLSGKIESILAVPDIQVYIEGTRSTTSTWCTQGSADDCNGPPATYSSGYRRVNRGFRPPSAWSLPGSCASQRVWQPVFKTIIKTWCRNRRSQDCPWSLLLDIRGCPCCHPNKNPGREWESPKGPSPSLASKSQTGRVYLKINSWILVLRVMIQVKDNDGIK